MRRSSPNPVRRDAAPQCLGGNTGRNNGFYAGGAAVSPSKIGLSTPRPGGFDVFWDAKLAAQAKITSVGSFVGATRQHDDITCLVMRMT